jgi:hypothetical protein
VKLPSATKQLPRSPTQASIWHPATASLEPLDPLTTITMLPLIAPSLAEEWRVSRRCASRDAAPSRLRCPRSAGHLVGERGHHAMGALPECLAGLSWGGVAREHRAAPPAAGVGRVSPRLPRHSREDRGPGSAADDTAGNHVPFGSNDERETRLATGHVAASEHSVQTTRVLIRDPISGPVRRHRLVENPPFPAHAGFFGVLSLREGAIGLFLPAFSPRVPRFGPRGMSRAGETMLPLAAGGSRGQRREYRRADGLDGRPPVQRRERAGRQG